MIGQNRMLHRNTDKPETEKGKETALDFTVYTDGANLHFLAFQPGNVMETGYPGLLHTFSGSLPQVFPETHFELGQFKMSLLSHSADPRSKPNNCDNGLEHQP